MPKTRVYVGRLRRDVKQSDLEDEFAKFGKWTKFEVKIGHAFIVQTQIILYLTLEGF